MPAGIVYNNNNKTRFALYLRTENIVLTPWRVEQQQPPPSFPIIELTFFLFFFLGLTDTCVPFDYKQRLLFCSEI